MNPVYDIEFLAVEIKVDFDQVKYDAKNHYTHPAKIRTCEIIGG